MLRYINSMGMPIENVLFVELAADMDVRLVRNRRELRLKEKKSKNNIEQSEHFLIESTKQYQLNTNGDFMNPDSILELIILIWNPKKQPVA